MPYSTPPQGEDPFAEARGAVSPEQEAADTAADAKADSDAPSESGDAEADKEPSASAADGQQAATATTASEVQESEAETVALPPQPTDVRSWLQQLDCEDCLQAFLDAGYDEIRFLHSLERSDYAEIGIADAQLQTKLAASLMQIDRVGPKGVGATFWRFLPVSLFRKNHIDNLPHHLGGVFPAGDRGRVAGGSPA